MSADTKLEKTDFRANIPRFQPDALLRNAAFVDLLKRVGASRGATPAQLALAWLLAQRPYIVPIPGTTKLSRLEENLGAATVTLSLSELAEIKTALAGLEVEGDRYTPAAQAMAGVEAPEKETL